MIRFLLSRVFPVTLLPLAIWAGAPTTINDFILPGSQPNEAGNFETPDKCDNCHGSYDLAVEPSYNWRGSMMAQAQRDPIYRATMSIANQDAPESGDLCLRCHTPAGWLEGRSVPTDGSALSAADYEGIHCDFCHKLVHPAAIGSNPFPNDPIYTSDTYPADTTLIGTLSNPATFSADGMYEADGSAQKRGPFSDAVPKHQWYYSPFHSEAAICGTCHDVSNPVFSKDANGKYVPNAFDTPAPDADPRELFPVERTYSEWVFSAYNSLQGVYAPQFGGNLDTVRTCQDCHMRNVTGVGANKAGTPTRDDLPLHDMTGGNTFVPNLVKLMFTATVDTAALSDGVIRATYMLQNAATMELTATPQTTTFQLSAQITNETGHKLPSGYPEGRRIWINVRSYNSSDQLIYESGAYDSTTAELAHDSDVKIYQIKPGISETLAPVVGEPAGPSFHFVLNDTIYSDNRIPPRGFTNANYEFIQSPPVAYSYADGQYWDLTDYTIPGATARVEVRLYYQTISKEYADFLLSENTTDTMGTSFYNLWSNNGKSAPIVMVADTLFLTPLVENSPPVVTCPGDITQPADADECGAIVTFSVTATDDQPGVIVTATPPSGSFFPVGTTPVMGVATDSAGLADTCYFNVIITDGQSPTVACPADTTVYVGPDSCTISVDYTVTFEDNCPVATVTVSPTSGSSFTLGAHLVIAIATDNAGNADSCSFTVTVVDNIAPVLTCPADITVPNDSSVCGAAVAFTFEATDNCGTPTVVVSPESGTFFPIGTTEVTAIATDVSGNADTCTFNVTVNDTEPPIAHCPNDTIVPSESGLNGATVTFEFTASDNCAVDSVWSIPESGSLLPIGINVITVIARDETGLVDSCTFTVTVTADDTDNDGTPDTGDNCPFTYNPDQLDDDQDGYGDLCDICPGFDDDIDSDNDGVPDGCDGCPNDPDKLAPGDCGCGVPDTDTDNDGIADCVDICPGFDDLADFDGDGYPDSCDNCPETFNPGQEDNDQNGVGDACESQSCCGLYTNNYTGNTNCSEDGKRNLADITRLIDRVYIGKQPLCCEENGNIDGDLEGKINLADITRLVDHVYISKGETALCP